MEFVILGLLHEGGLTIYDLNKCFKQSISLFYGASLGNIQGALKKLIEKGWVTVETLQVGGRTKKVHHLTPIGKTAFSEWMHQSLSESKLETIMLSKIFFLGLIEDAKSRRTIIQDMIQTVEQVLAPLLQQEKALEQLNLPKDLSPIHFHQIATLKYGIGAHQFALEWLKGLGRDEVNQG